MTDDDDQDLDRALDITALLRSALADHALPGGFQQRVMDRLAAARTVVELARLIGVAPLSGIAGRAAPSNGAPEGAARPRAGSPGGAGDDDDDDEGSR